MIILKSKTAWDIISMWKFKVSCMLRAINLFGERQILKVCKPE